MFLYSRVSTPQHFSKRFTLYSLANQFKHYLDFSEKHPATIKLMHEDYSYTHIYHCLQPGTQSYRYLNWSNGEQTNLPKVGDSSTGFES